MSNSLSNVIIFTVGAVIGSIVTWKIVKSKYEAISKEEIESVRELYLGKIKRLKGEKSEEEENDISEEVSEESTDEDKDIDNYKKVVEELNYAETEEKYNNLSKPYVITPDEFGEMEEYERAFYTLYSDGVLTDDFDEVVNDVDDIIGEENIKHMGEYEPDCLFVRNDKIMTDFEILLDEKNYKEASHPQTYGG